MAADSAAWVDLAAVAEDLDVVASAAVVLEAEAGT